MALRAGYYGVKRFLRDKLMTIAKTYDETIKSLFPRSEQTVLGAKNLLPFPYYETTKTVDSGTITVNADGSVTCNGTFTNGANFELLANTTLVYDRTLLFNGCPSGGDIVNKYGVQIYTTAHPGNPLNDVGNGDVSIDANDTITRIVIRIRAGQVLNNLTFYPMLRLASDTDDTYVPYAMTNKVLTDSAADQKNAINAIITAATGAADFAAFKTAMGAITPVTRSLSLTKEDITEEVKEVKPEKTVTKKRTTKKTEEV